QNGSPLRYDIASNGTGMGNAIVTAVAGLANNIAMDVKVIWEPIPDNPLSVDPGTNTFQFQARAVDQPGDGCPAVEDRDGDDVFETHRACRPGATPRFQVTFTNPNTPNNVPDNPNDNFGGYNMRLALIGNDQYVIDRVPVYIIPRNVIPNPGAPVYAASGTYHQDVVSTGCLANEQPTWNTLAWNASLPADT